MGLRETLQNWLRPTQHEELEGAEVEEAADEVSTVRADELADMRLGSNADEFDADQEAPRT
ncbi:MAG: hypothetical protein ACR2HI_06140 [Gaiella sp.]